MAKNVKVKTVSNLSNNSFLGLIFIVLGIFFIMNGSSLLSTLFTILGAILIVLGATELFDRNWIVGAVEIVAGALIIVFGNVILSETILILGIVILAYAIYLLVIGIIKNKNAGAARIILSLVAPLLLLVVGILLILQYCGVANLPVVIGAISIAVGAFIVFYELIKTAVRNSRKK